MFGKTDVERGFKGGRNDHSKSCDFEQDVSLDICSEDADETDGQDVICLKKPSFGLATSTCDRIQERNDGHQSSNNTMWSCLQIPSKEKSSYETEKY